MIDQLIDTATPQTIARLKAHLSKERNALEKGDGAATIRLGADFHSLLAKEAGNELIAELTDELLARIALIMVLYKHSYSAHSHCLQDEHQQLVECIERKDRDRALALVGSHLGSVESSLMTEETSEAGLLKQVLLRNLPEQEER